MTGVDIKVRVGPATVVRCKRVTVDGATGEIDETDGESGGYGETDENGVFQADVTFECWMRRSDLAPIVEGDLLTDVLIAWDGNVAVPVVNKRHAFPKLKVLKASTNGEVRGGSIAYTFTCKSSGPYAPPGIASFTRSSPVGFDKAGPDVEQSARWARAKPKDAKPEKEMAA